MSTDSFVPSIWAASVLRGFEKTSVFASAVSRDYAGELKNKGDVVKVPQVAPVAIRDYTRGGPISYDTVSGSTMDITVTEEKYWALRADDINKMQSAVPFLDAAVMNAAYALRDTVDAYTAGILTNGAQTKLYADAPFTLGDAGTDAGVAKTISLFTGLAQSLDELNVPRAGRFLVVPPYVLSALTEAVIRAATSNEASLSEAFIGRIAGFNIYMSNNLITDADGNATIVGGISKAATLIMQIDKVEKLRDQSSFSDLVRGLAVYVAAPLLPAGLVVANPAAD